MERKLGETEEHAWGHHLELLSMGVIWNKLWALIGIIPLITGRYPSVRAESEDGELEQPVATAAGANAAERPQYGLQ